MNNVKNEIYGFPDLPTAYEGIVSFYFRRSQMAGPHTMGLWTNYFLKSYFIRKHDWTEN